MTRLVAPLAFLAVAGAAAAQPKDDDAPPDVGRVLPVFDPGTHVARIAAVGFTADGKRLVTAGEDFTVQVWNAGTGDRLDVLRLAGYGRETGTSGNRWDKAAVSPDGTLVAVGGQPMPTGRTDGKADTARLVLADVPGRRARRILPRAQQTGSVTAVAFAPDGNRLAVTVGKETFVFDDVKLAFTPLDGRQRSLPRTLVATATRQPAIALAWSPDSRQLIVPDDSDDKLGVWAVPPGGKPERVRDIPSGGRTLAARWSPDGQRVAVGFGAASVDSPQRFGVWVGAPDGTGVRTWAGADFRKLFPGVSGPADLTFAGPDTLYMLGTSRGGTGGLGMAVWRLDLATAAATPAYKEAGSAKTEGVLAAAADGKTVAFSLAIGRQAAVFRPDAGMVLTGGWTPVPCRVGWAADPVAPGFAWTDESVPRGRPIAPDKLRYGFSLARMEPTAGVAPTDYRVGSPAADGVAFGVSSTQTNPTVKVTEGGKPAGEFNPPGTVRTLAAVPVPGGRPLVAHSAAFLGSVEQAHLRKADGTLVAELLPRSLAFSDFVPSPDGRYVLAATGTPRLNVYRTDGRRYPMLSFAGVNGEWVLWSPEGYYAASPGGERLFGWAVHNGTDELMTFLPADKFAAHFRRPDVLKLAVEKGSVADALAALKTVAPDVEQILPPAAKLELVRQDGGTVTVRATATSGAKDKPVQAMRVLLDGRPLPEGRGVWPPAATQKASAEFTLDVPPGPHELKVLARGPDGSAVSDPVAVRGPKSAAAQPTLHRVCVGVNAYADPKLNLKAAVPDARAMYDALPRHCVGPDNKFGRAAGELLADADATRDRVLKALAAARKAARPGDLLVVFFAGHGVKQDNQFYLLTREADPAGKLDGRSLSGADLRAALAEVECPVLLVLDACHSAAAVRALAPATDDLTRSLTDDAVGVTVLSAAMGYEVAGATAENGHFTAGLLKGLAAGDGVPFDPYERQLYVHHLYAVAFTEVRRATGGKQNPFLNLPWTAPPVAVREVPGK